jgi:hypothetical protein
MRPLRLTLLLAGIAACVPEGGAWQHGAVALSPTPVVLRPPFLLNPGKVRAELCLGLADSVWRMASPADFARVDTSTGIRFADGRLVRIQAEVRTTSGAQWSHSSGHLVGPFDKRPAEWCFSSTAPDEPVPRYAAIALSATSPLRVAYVRWQAAAFGSL